MAAYYLYLWHTTWPAVVALLAIWLLILIQLGLGIKNTWHHERDAWGFFVLTWKLLLWIGILVVYTTILINANKDWLSRPVYLKGTVEQKLGDSTAKSGRRYTVKLSNSGLDQEYYIDAPTYKNLHIGDKVELMVLPHSQEVVSCEVLDHKSESD